MSEISVARPIGVRTPVASRVGAIDDHMVSLISPNSFEAEQYRALRQAVDRMRPPAGPSVIAISSPGIGDGKTTTAVNLAGAYAQSLKSRVLLVDADLRRPGIGSRLGMTGSETGLAELLADPSLDLDVAIRKLTVQNLSVMTAGRGRTEPHLLLQSERLPSLMSELRVRFDKIIVDTPPVLAVRDSNTLEGLVDGFVLVVSSGTTSRHCLAETLDAMEPSKVLGIVFNCDSSRFASSYRVYGRYYAKSR